jgi:hypothetical protein
VPVAHASPEYLTPPEYAARIRVKPSKVIGLIRAGLLAAIDSADPGSSRPRYRIKPEAIEEFERRRSVTPSLPRVRRRRSPAIESFV